MEATGDLEQRLCPQHHRELEFYCNTDQTPVCALCVLKQHHGHDIVEQGHQMKESGLGKGLLTLTGDYFQIGNLTVQPQLIQKGSPDCYLLPTEKTGIGGSTEVRRWTFGKIDKSKPVKNILVVGETGTGKTTLINTMVNYMLGVKCENKVWFQITEEDKSKSQAKSQTTDITVYEVFVGTSPLALRIIDTPGYGSTDGIEDDRKMAENLLKLFRAEDGIQEISAVLLVVKAGCNRLTGFQRYIFDAVLSLFGEDVKENIVVMITHSDGMSPEDVFTALNEAKVPVAKDARRDPLHFIFNNRQSKGYKEKDKHLWLGAWDLGYNNIKGFLDFLHATDVRKLKMTRGVLRERKRLEASVNNLQEAIKEEVSKQTELQQIQRALEEFKSKFGKNKDFIYEIDEPYKDLVPIELKQLPWWTFTTKAMCCTKCEENCHYPYCWWASEPSDCSAMKGNNCTVCTNKCPASAHIKHGKIYVSKTRKVKKVAYDLKQKYKKDGDLRKALEESKVKIKIMLEKAYECIVKLEEIALKKDSRVVGLHLDFLMEKMKETGDHEKVQKLEQIKELFQPGADEYEATEV